MTTSSTEPAVLRIHDLLVAEMEIPRGVMGASATLMPSGFVRGAYWCSNLAVLYSLVVFIMDLMQIIALNPILDVFQWWQMLVSGLGIWAGLLFLHLCGAMYLEKVGLPDCPPQPHHRETHDAKKHKHAKAGIKCKETVAMQNLLDAQRWRFMNRLSTLYFVMFAVFGVYFGSIFVIYRDRNNATTLPQAYLNNSGLGSYFLTTQMADGILFIVFGAFYALAFILQLPKWIKLSEDVYNVDRVMGLSHPIGFTASVNIGGGN